MRAALLALALLPALGCVGLGQAVYHHTKGRLCLAEVQTGIIGGDLDQDGIVPGRPGDTFNRGKGRGSEGTPGTPDQRRELDGAWVGGFVAGTWDTTGQRCQ